MYYTIIKQHVVNDKMIIDIIGYVDNMEDAARIDDLYQRNFQDWVDENKEALISGTVVGETYFETNLPVYQSNWSTDEINEIEVNNIPLITDLENLEVY